MEFKKGDIIVFKIQMGSVYDLNHLNNNICISRRIIDLAEKHISKEGNVYIEHHPLSYDEQSNPFRIITVIPSKLVNNQGDLCLVQSKFNNKNYIILYEFVRENAIPYVEYQVGDILDLSKIDRERIDHNLYCSYDEWMLEYAPQYIDYWCDNAGISIDEHIDKFEIVATASHLDRKACKLFLIQSLLTGSCYMIDGPFIYCTPEISRIVTISDWFD